MSPDMFAQIADKGLGETDIEWDFVPCPITDAIEIKMHSGSSQNWFAATVVNAKRRTAKLEVGSDDGSTWEVTTRNVHNYFELEGGTGTMTAWIRAPSHTGTTVIIKDVDMSSGKTLKGISNYT